MAPAQEPPELVNFGESVNFPLLFGAALSLFGAATMVHLLLVSVRRRRTEVGLLKVPGFVRHQAVAVVGWEATTVALVGIAAGLPLGIAAGNLTWRVSASAAARGRCGSARDRGLGRAAAPAQEAGRRTRTGGGPALTHRRRPSANALPRTRPA